MKKGDIYLRINEIANKINAPSYLLPTFDKPQQDGRPHIEIKNNKIHFVITERFNELERRSTDNIDELLYWVFDGVTHQMAVNRELNERNDNEDFRRKMFKIQLDLMRQISNKYYKKLQGEINQILIKAPFKD